MRNSIFSKDLLPQTQPYTNLDISNSNQSINSNINQNSVVDWVIVVISKSDTDDAIYKKPFC